METLNETNVTIRENYEPLVRVDPAEFELRPQYYKQGFVDDPTVWLREGVVERLRAVKAMLPPGWTIRIWDGWRSMVLQTTLYERLLVELQKQQPTFNETQIVELTRGYLHPPTKNPPPPHTTGGTIDLTLVNGLGEALNFGTGFDEFTERAHLDYFDHHTATSRTDQEAKANRQQLRFLMGSQDFVGNPKEWWHWTYGTAQWAAVKGITIARYGRVEPPVSY